MCLYIAILINVAQVVSILLDTIALHQENTASLLQSEDECQNWQSVAEQQQVLNDLKDSVISAKSSFLAGLANEMKAIVHGSTQIIMSMLCCILIFL